MTATEIKLEHAIRYLHICTYTCMYTSVHKMCQNTLTARMKGELLERIALAIKDLGLV